MNTTPSKITVKQRIKNRAPEIMIVTGVAITIACIITVRKAALTELSHFAKNAADPTVEVITGNDKAFAVMTTAAADHLVETGYLELHDGDVGRFALTYLAK
jgi:hypothetical protein